MTAETSSTRSAVDGLAERLYTTWRSRQDFVAPLSAPDRYDGSVKPRPRWADLTTLEQSVWRGVAEAAGALP